MTDDYAFEGCDHHRVPVSWPECPCDNPDRCQHDADMEAAAEIVARMFHLVWTEKRGSAICVCNKTTAFRRFAALTMLVNPGAMRGMTYTQAARMLGISQEMLIKYARNIQRRVGLRFRRTKSKTLG